MMANLQFYTASFLIAAITSSVAVWWDRRYIKRLWIKTYREELRRELKIRALTNGGEEPTEHNESVMDGR